MNCTRYVCPAWIRCPSPCRSATFQITSAPYPSLLMLANPPGGASGIPAHTFFAGSAPTVITPVVGFRIAVFHVPHTFDGACALALFAGSDCQSPPRAFGSAVTSVMNSAGKIGRPNGSVPFSRLPAVGRHPTCGDVRQPGVPGYGDTVPAHPLCVTP